MMTPAEVHKAPKGFRVPGIMIEIGCVEMLRDGDPSESDPGAAVLDAHIVAKANLAQTRRAIREFCQRYVEYS